MTFSAHRRRFLGATAVALATFLAPIVRAADETPTVITSDTADMVSSESQSTFTFRNNVVVTGTNMKITCHELVVVANRSGDPKATIGKQDKFQSLVAMGDVRIVQNDREATCERAEVFPGEDKVVLTGHPVVQSLDGQYRADGPRLVLYRGQRRAVIEGGPTERSHITLPPLKDLGYGKEADKNTPANSTNSSNPAPKQ
jgi:lipopolysaccharide export system protein LptA